MKLRKFNNYIFQSLLEIFNQEMNASFMKNQKFYVNNKYKNLFKKIKRFKELQYPHGSSIEIA